MRRLPVDRKSIISIDSSKEIIFIRLIVSFYLTIHGSPDSPDRFTMQSLVIFYRGRILVSDKGLVRSAIDVLKLKRCLKGSITRNVNLQQGSFIVVALDQTSACLRVQSKLVPAC